jgi:hypothetical protein
VPQAPQVLKEFLAQQQPKETLVHKGPLVLKEYQDRQGQLVNQAQE